MAIFPTFDRLITHRFREFSPYENTIEGLESAMDFGVQLLEFDVRVSKCGIPVVYHDEYAKDRRGKKRYLHEVEFDDFQKIGGAFSRMPSLEQLLARAAMHSNISAKLLVDIKDYGLHEAVDALVHLFRLQNRSIYVSWLPEVLFALDKTSPDIPKCLSHWSGPTNTLIMATHKVMVSRDGVINETGDIQPVGIRSGWSIRAPIKGEMLTVLKRSHGGVCMPARMATKSLSAYYHDHGLFVSTYSYTTTKAVKKASADFDIDYYFIDKKIVFDDLV